MSEVTDDKFKEAVRRAVRHELRNNQQESVDRDDAKVTKLYERVFEGNGQPSLTSQMTGAETEIANLKHTLANIDKKFWAVVLMFGAGLVHYFFTVLK